MTKKRGSLTGSNDGYTFFELLVTIAILTTGFLFLFPALFSSAQNIEYISKKYEAHIAAHNLLTDIEQHLSKDLTLTPWPSSGSASAGGYEFPYTASITPAVIHIHPKTGEQIYIYRVNVTLNWKANRRGELQRSTYVVR